MAMIILFYDGNKADLDDFVSKQNEVVSKDTDHRTRNLVTINSLAEMVALRLPELTPDIAFFDLYQGNDYDPYALLAAKSLGERRYKFQGEPHIPSVYFLAPKSAPIPQEVHQAIHDGVALGIVAKENAPVEIEQLILGIRDY